MRKHDPYDLEYRNNPLNTTIKRRPAFVKHIFFHRLFFFTWLLIGLISLVLLLAELMGGMVNKYLLKISQQDDRRETETKPAEVYGFISQYASPVSLGLIVVFAFFSFLFLLCAYYCARLIKRSQYIRQLEKAAMAETAFILKEKENAYRAKE